jgi:ribonuclease HI
VIIEERQKAILTAKSRPESELHWFVDGSNKNSLVGIGLACYRSMEPWEYQEQLGPSTTISTYQAELVAIQRALEFTAQAANTLQNTTLVIFSDSQAVLRALANPGQGSGQQILRSCLHGINMLKERYGINIFLRWVPSHSRVVGNKVAHKLA